MERLNKVCGGPKVSAELKWSSSLPGAQAQAVDAFTVPLRSSLCDFSQMQSAEEEWDSVSLRSAWKAVCLGELCCAPDTCALSLLPATSHCHFRSLCGVGGQEPPGLSWSLQIHPGKQRSQVLQALKEQTSLCLYVGSMMED